MVTFRILFVQVLRSRNSLKSPWFPFLIQSLKRIAMERKRTLHFMMNIMKTLKFWIGNFMIPWLLGWSCSFQRFLMLQLWVYFLFPVISISCLQSLYCIYHIFCGYSQTIACMELWFSFKWFLGFTGSMVTLVWVVSSY